MNAAMTQSTLVGTRSGAVGQPQAFDVAQARYLSEMNEDAIADEIVLASSIEPNARRNGNRSRSLRTSEGSSLPRTDGRRENGGDLRCNKCGKGYKHSSCLAKHLFVPLDLMPSSQATCSHEGRLHLSLKSLMHAMTSG